MNRCDAKPTAKAPLEGGAGNGFARAGRTPLAGLLLCAAMAGASAGCSLLPVISHQPRVHNPFPQLHKIAVAPFFNLSGEPTVDGRQFAEAYYSELQAVPGFEVIPVGVVERAMLEKNISLNSAEETRRLAQVLGADAVVVGAVTDYSPYYPPQCGLQVEWYAANPGFHPIPPGYGLPWGTAEESEIPERLIFEAEFALAREQLATQTPPCPTEPASQAQSTSSQWQPSQSGDISEPQPQRPPPPPQGRVEPASYQRGAIAAGMQEDTMTEPRMPSHSADLPGDWPDPRGLVPPGPRSNPAPCQPSNRPVLTHTKIYHGNDADFTAALANYFEDRDDARFGGWQSYLERSDDFIRFCCRMHIWEMLTARGGASKSKVVWRFHEIR